MFLLHNIFDCHLKIFKYFDVEVTEKGFSLFVIEL